MNINSKVFDMMEAVADESRVDISEHDILPEILKGSIVKEKDKRLSVGQIKANKSFDAFIKKLQTSSSNPTWDKRYELSESQIGKLREFWEAGGKPIIKIHSMGETGGMGDKNRAYFEDKRVEGDEDKHVDLIGLFPKRLLNNFLAEMGHSFKYAKKEGESKNDWISRRGKLNRTVGWEREMFGEKVYGYELPAGLGREIQHGISDKDRKFFPGEVSYGKTYSIGEEEGKEVVVDEEGNVYPDMKVPEWDVHYDEEGKERGRTRGTSWGYPTWENVEFDPKTRLGVGGQSLTQEFEAHSVKEDSLWNVLDEEGFFDVLEADLSEYK